MKKLWNHLDKRELRDFGSTKYFLGLWQKRPNTKNFQSLQESNLKKSLCHSSSMTTCWELLVMPTQKHELYFYLTSSTYSINLKNWNIIKFKNLLITLEKTGLFKWGKNKSPLLLCKQKTSCRVDSYFSKKQLLIFNPSFIIHNSELRLTKLNFRNFLLQPIYVRIELACCFWSCVLTTKRFKSPFSCVIWLSLRWLTNNNNKKIILMLYRVFLHKSYCE